jgi:hypothetical protein
MRGKGSISPDSVPLLTIAPITMAEQEKYASHWNSNPSNPVRDSGSSTRFDSIFRGSGAEQDRHDSHFGLGPDTVKSATSRLNTINLGSGAEQDRHDSHFGLGENNPMRTVASTFTENSGSGAEQDRHESHFGLGANNPIKDAVSKFNSSRFGRGSSGSEQDRYDSHFSVWYFYCVERY